MYQALPYLALTTGLLSSLHCVGMCGPIAIALRSGGGTGITRWLTALSYHSGRLTAYAVLGFLVGQIGEVADWIGGLKYMSIAAGLIMFLYVLIPASSHLFRTPVWWRNAIKWLQIKMSAGIRSKTYTGRFVTGALNGLLPCGMVYMALAGSLATGSTFLGARYMFVFGAGTLPLMMGVSLLGGFMSKNLAVSLRKITPIFLLATGIWLIVRGVEVGHPHENHPGHVTICAGK